MNSRFDMTGFDTKTGQPPIIPNPETMLTKIQDYFEKCPDFRKITFRDKILDKTTGKYKTEIVSVDVPKFTMTGLAAHLGFASRQSLYDYEKRPEYSYIIKRAKMFIEREYEMMLTDGNPAGAIFALTNMNWKNKLHTEDETPTTRKYDDILRETEELLADEESKNERE